MDYPETLDIEKQIVKLSGKKLDVAFPERLLEASVLFVRTLRENDKLEKFPGVRASIGLYERAQANALLRSRKEVSIDDLKDAIVSVIAHRIKLKPSVEYLKSPEEFIKEELNKFTKQQKFSSTQVTEEEKGDYR
jgi:MoxR-like ATPase